MRHLYLLLLISPLIAEAQSNKLITDCPDCPCILQEAKRMESTEEFGNAIDLFNAYKACDPAGATASEEGIKRFFELISNQKDVILSEETHHYTIDQLKSFGMEFNTQDVELMEKKGKKW